MRALVTGAAGFLGSHLCDRLLAAGIEVVGVDNFLTGRPENLAHLDGAAGFHFLEHDITAPLDLPFVVEEVYHLASPASPKDYARFPVETLEAGSSGTRHALEIAHRYGARFLLASTSECYGDPLEHPQRETYWGNVNPVGPRSCYDESKRFAEALTMAWHRERDADTRIARIFNTYGPRMKLDDGRVVPAFVAQALAGEDLTIYGDGAQTRSFCYVSDLIEGFVLLMASQERYPVNLGNPDELTVREFAEAVRTQSGARCGLRFEPLPQDDPQRRRPDITKARQALGWEPKVGLVEGLRRTLEWFRGRPTPERPR